MPLTIRPSALFPVEPREIRYGRAARVALRSVHILAFSILFGGHWFGASADELRPFLYWAVASGAGLIFFELLSGFEWLFQLCGAMVFVKLCLLCLVPFYWSYRVPLIAAAMLISSAGSHMSRRYRHALWTGKFVILPERAEKASRC